MKQSPSYEQQTTRVSKQDEMHHDISGMGGNSVGRMGTETKVPLVDISPKLRARWAEQKAERDRIAIEKAEKGL